MSKHVNMEMRVSEAKKIPFTQEIICTDFHIDWEFFKQILVAPRRVHYEYWKGSLAAVYFGTNIFGGELPGLEHSIP